MSCLSPAELARIALGPGPDPDQAAHLERCERCRSGFESMCGLVQQLGRAHARFDDQHDEARAQLLAILPAASPQPVPAQWWSLLFSWNGVLTMRQRIALGTAGAAVMLACCIVWLATVAAPIYGMDELPATIRSAKSYDYTMTMNIPGEPGKAPAKAVMTGRFYWVAPGSYRIESRWGNDTTTQDQVMILPAGKPGIEIDRKLKRYVRQPARLGHVSPLMMLDKLSTFSGHADHELGTRQVAGKTAKGFEIAARKIDPDAYSGSLEIWVDSETHLPLLVGYEMKGPGNPGNLSLTDFHWNADLDQKLFDPTPPEGFA